MSPSSGGDAHGLQVPHRVLPMKLASRSAVANADEMGRASVALDAWEGQG